MKDHDADVTLLLEDTHPCAGGELSGWVQQHLQGLPELRFSVVYLGTRQPAGEALRSRYALPENVVHLDCHYLLKPAPPGRPRSCPGDRQAFAQSEALHDYLRQPEGPLPDGFLREFFAGFGSRAAITHGDFLFSEAAWECIRDRYQRHCTEPSFADYFQTVRAMHAPLFELARIAARLPHSRLYHALSTGYAGLLGAMLHHRHGHPLVLTEHGAGARERRLDPAAADGRVAEWMRHGGHAGAETGYLRRMWVRYFEGLGRLAYGAAGTIVASHEEQRQRQARDGADPRRTRIIPAGVDLRRFQPLRRQRPAEVPKVLGLLGRVAPGKDVKTFIRAMRAVCEKLPAAEGWIVGPADEERAYARECQELVAALGLAGRVRFLGPRKVDEVLPQLGLLVLTSIGEALPLVLLQGFASGLPAVATDVGPCRELLGGGAPADRALGRAGALVPVADPEAVARAALALLLDPLSWRNAQEAATQRVLRYYDHRDGIQRYRGIYEKALEQE